MTLGAFSRSVLRYRATSHGFLLRWGTRDATTGASQTPCPHPHVNDLAVDVIYPVTPDLDAARDLAHSFGLALTRATRHDHLEPLTIGD